VHIETEYTKTGKVKITDRTKLMGAASDNLRRIHKDDVKRFAKEVEKAFGTDAKRVRLYSSDGFVAKSYGYAAPIEYLEADIGEEGALVLRYGTVDGRRPDGKGSLLVIG
jgi:hypothetical protein